MMKFAIVCAAGIGDALLMQIASTHLRRLGHSVVTFSNHLSQLRDWFPGCSFAPQPQLDRIEEIFAPFDAIILQHDNTPKAKKIRALAKPVYSLYGAHLVSKHGLFRPEWDYLLDRNLCMAKNIQAACQVLFPGMAPLLDNGLTPLSHLLFRRFPKRIAIHPVSTSEQKNWPRSRFLHLHELLEKKGYEPVFIAPPDEAADWKSPTFNSLSDLASYIYESGAFIGNDSGPGHLASNLGLDTLIIGPSLEHLTLWRPGWKVGAIVHPPRWIHEFKLSWKNFISVSQVYKSFAKLNVIK
jgi:ADP-heptose:LPS heptosyltransferase